MTWVFTVVVPQIGDRVLLGYKKTKIGKGLWNGFGGRVEAGETIDAAARRELQEETGLTAQGLEHAGTITARWQDTDEVFELHFYRASAVSGTPRETREMRPRWFVTGEVPYDQMWEADRYWLPLLLAGRLFAGTMRYDNLEDRNLLEHDIREVVSV